MDLRSEEAGSALQPPSPPPTTPGRAKRLREWFWRGGRMAALSRSDLAAWQSASELRRRAKLAAELADQLLDRPEAPELGRAESMACEVYRQAIYWALLTLAHPRFEGERDLASVWRGTDPSLLLSAAGGDDALITLERALLAGSFENFAERPSDEQTQLAWRLRSFVAVLLENTDAAKTELNILRFERATRLGALALLIAVPVVIVLMLLSLHEQGSDLAINKPWRASSSGYQGCRSPQQFCDETPSFFFHTADEKNPWVELDLGAKTTFSAVRVLNRTDCCRERAVPLVVEVGDDQTKWKTVAQRDTSFRSWKATFAPVAARYVRVRSTGKTILHLSGVRVLP